MCSMTLFRVAKREWTVSYSQVHIFPMKNPIPILIHDYVAVHKALSRALPFIGSSVTTIGGLPYEKDTSNRLFLHTHHVRYADFSAILQKQVGFFAF